MPLDIVHLTEIIPTRWRNGRGLTRELTAEDRATRDPGWRISVAEIARSGPFSRFGGYDRTLAVISGRGILRIGSKPYRLLRGMTLRFAGEADVTAKVARTPLRALNIMTDRRRFSHQVVILSAGTPLPHQDGMRLFVAMQPMRYLDYILAAGDLVRLETGADMMPFPGRIACLGISRNR